MRTENYIKKREIIYALMKTVCNNTNNFVQLKTRSKSVLYAQLHQNTREIIYTPMRTENYINIREK